MPILVRPVREQLEHDRVIRLLQAKYKRKFDVGINPGMEQSAPIGSGLTAIYPDLVLQSSERGRKLLGVVEVETSESVNHLEAMSQWASLGRLRAPFYLYVPASSIDTARRLCADLQVPVTEIWTFHAVGDQVRFTLVHKGPGAASSAERPVAEPPTAKAEKPPRPARAEAPRPGRGEPARANRRAVPAPRRAAAAKNRVRPASKTTTKAARGKKKTASVRTSRTQKRK